MRSIGYRLKPLHEGGDSHRVAASPTGGAHADEGPERQRGHCCGANRAATSRLCQASGPAKFVQRSPSPEAPSMRLDAAPAGAVTSPAHSPPTHTLPPRLGGAAARAGRPTDGAPKWRAWCVGLQTKRGMSALGEAVRRPVPTGKGAPHWKYGSGGQRSKSVGHSVGAGGWRRQLGRRSWAMRAMPASQQLPRNLLPSAPVQPRMPPPRKLPWSAPPQRGGGGSSRAGSRAR